MGSLSLSKAIEGFILACDGRGLSTHTVDDYKNTFRKFIAHVGDVPIDSIVGAQVSAFLAAQSKRIGKKTMLNYHIGLSALWTWAVREGYARDHILHNVERPKPKQIAIQPFTDIEIRALMHSIQHSPERNRALILLLLDTGARASEICNLKRSEIDLVKRNIKVTGKGDKERLLPFSARTGSALFNHLAHEDGEPFKMNRTGLSQYLRRLGKRAGVPDTHPHRFRHTAAITMLRCGMDIYSLQEILGHSTLDMVKRYLAIAQIDIESAHRRASPVENWKL
ncbi:MAG: tyrosine-type recombinase/integrase [Anaerolineales bacterium]|nr:tyrosine-type recombinase/integrase [Anaerolineales bacterium]